MTSFGLRVGIAVVLLTATGCQNASERSEISAQPIVGGTTDDVDPAVVAVMGQNPKSRGWWFATGVLISPHVVLTAAHVLDPVASLGTSVYRVVTGTDAKAGFGNPAYTRVVTETHFDSAFDPSNYQNGHDVGVLVLASSTGIAPIAVNRRPIDASWVGLPIRYVGYGKTQADASASIGMRRQAFSTVGSVDPLFLNTSDGGPQPCFDDSGGPGFVSIAGVDVLAVLTSFGDSTCTSASLTRVDDYQSLIDGWIAQFDPPTDANVPDDSAPTIGSTPADPDGAMDAADETALDGAAFNSANDIDEQGAEGGADAGGSAPPAPAQSARRGEKGCSVGLPSGPCAASSSTGEAIGVWTFLAGMLAHRRRLLSRGRTGKFSTALMRPYVLSRNRSYIAGLSANR